MRLVARRSTGWLLVLLAGLAAGAAVAPREAAAVRLLTESFDDVAPPALPPGWTTEVVGGVPGDQPWTNVGTTFGGLLASATNAAFAAGPDHVTDKQLTSPSVFVTTPVARLAFLNVFDLEESPGTGTAFDGAVLEISIAGGAFQDILVAGGSFEFPGGYTHTVSPCCANPLAGRPAWSGSSPSGGTIVNLPPAASGNFVQLRWRVGTDYSVARGGQYIDFISLVDHPSVVSEVEPNNTPGDAVALYGATEGVLGTGKVTAGDVDFWSFEAPAGARAWILVDTGGSQSAGATSRDSVLDLFLQSGVLLYTIESDDDGGTGTGGGSFGVVTPRSSAIAGRTLAIGDRYFARVKASNPADVIGPYLLLVAVTTQNPVPEVEPNDTVATATPFMAPASHVGLRSGVLGQPGDVDVYSVAVAEGDVLFVSVDADPERDGTGTDLIVDILNQDGISVLMSSHPAGVGSLSDPAAASLWLFARAGVYFVRVRHALPEGTGSYHLMVARTSALYGDMFDQIWIASGPGGSPNPVPANGLVQLGLAAVDEFGYPIRYAWSVSCPGGANGTLSDASAAAPIWTPPRGGPARGTPYACTVDVTLDSGHGITKTASFSQTVGLGAPFTSRRLPAVQGPPHRGPASGETHWPVGAAASRVPAGGVVGLPSVTACDLDGDGVAEIVTAPGPGDGVLVRVWRPGLERVSLLAEFQAYDPGFAGGVFVACGDLEGSGRAHLVTGADAGGGPHVRVWRLDGAAVTEVVGFYAYDSDFTGGVRVAVGDLDGDGRADLVTGTGPGGVPHVRVFDGAALARGRMVERGSVMAYEPGYTGGVHVVVEAAAGARGATVVTTAGAGDPSTRRVFEGSALARPDDGSDRRQRK